MREFENLGIWRYGDVVINPSNVFYQPSKSLFRKGK